MSSIPPAVSRVLQAKQQATAQQIETALLKKNLDAGRQQADAINALLQQAAELQAQLVDGHLDIRV